MRDEFSKIGFVKTYLLPVFLILVGPLFSVWFFGYAENSVDGDIRANILKSIRGDKSISEADRPKLLEMYGKFKASALLASEAPELAEMRQKFDKVSFEFWTFRTCKRIAWICILTAVGAFVLGAIAVLISLRSQVVQYWSLAAGWHMLKLVSALQVILQGVLAVVLSYWVTALFVSRIDFRLIALAALGAGAAVIAVFSAIFKRLDTTFPLKGTLLEPERAKSLWARVGEMATALNIPKPDQIVVGIDDNFFVTEHPVTLDGKEVPGKTLFMSLPMLKILEKEEAAAVMAHEMGHFSGQDTMYSRKISPILGRFHAYLEALHEQPLARPVFYFMLFFRSLYELSLRKTSREREFRADSIAVQLTSAKALANALIKSSAYSKYRAQVESKLFDQETVMESARIAAGIAEGFPAFIAKGLSLEELGAVATEHPFDSHPPLLQRLSAVGVELDPTHREDVLLVNVEQSWNGEIEGGEEIEGAQWKVYEDAFRAEHEKSLAYRYLPANESEQKLVEQYFPQLQIDSETPGAPIVLDFGSVRHPAWANPVRLEDIQNCKGEETSGKNYLNITHRPPAAASDLTEKICTSAMPGGGQPFLDAFSHYYSRHLTAKEYQKMQKAKEQEQK